ncbi:UNVERIFIED_CONTAM: hypothetical protein GTU68_048353 [Idotea baltica]|nr:hypothetical protein [Idotea baltica]
MAGQLIGYRRVSSFDQNPDRQLSELKLDRVFTDKVSGKDRERPQLKELILFAREGDTIIIHSMDRLARNLVDLKNLVTEFTLNGIKVQFIKEGFTYSNEDTPIAVFMLSMMGAVAEFERSLHKERQREGIELAKKKGLYKGRKPALDGEQIKEVVIRANGGENKSSLAREFKISRETVYKYIREAKK